jgi:FSR family fosmidomycin resistance protein-like MFS transporter
MTVLLAALAVELVDEVFDGTTSAAMPLIRHDLTLSYAQIGLLSAVPLIAGGILELPVGVVSGTGRRRRLFILAGGLVFTASVLAAGLAPAFAELLIALTVFFPASGTFVSLTQSTLMDSNPDRRAQNMTRWTVAGAIGAVAGPLLLAGVAAAGGTWRLAVGLVAAGALLAWLAVAVTSSLCRRPEDKDTSTDQRNEAAAWPGFRAAARIARRSGALRWLLLLQLSDLLLDIFTGFLAVYLVADAHASASVAALGVAVRLGSGLAGDLIGVRLLARADSRRVLRASVWLALVLFPAFLMVPGLGPKLVLLAGVSVVTAPWYPVLQAGLYGSLPGRSGLAVSLSSAAGLAGGVGPLAVGYLAEVAGLGWAMAALCAVPLAMLVAGGCSPTQNR